MNHSLAAPNAAIPQPERAIPSAITDLHSSIGDLRTAANILQERLQNLAPGGLGAGKPESTNTPQVARSHVCDGICNAASLIREVTDELRTAAQRIEV